MSIAAKKGEKNFKEFLKSMGYSDEEEFIKEAVEDKILSLRKKAFFEITDKVKDSLIKKGVAEKEILEAFED